jgi:hypothetical protein
MSAAVVATWPAATATSLATTEVLAETDTIQ